MLQLKILNGKCAKIHTTCGSKQRKITWQQHSIIACCAPHIYIYIYGCCPSHTSRLWRIAQIAYQPGRYMGFTDISVSAKTALAVSRCWQNAVIFLTHADALHNKVQ